MIGGQLNGAQFDVGVIATTAGGNNWPNGEPPSEVVSGDGQKYLNFAELNTGVIVTPAGGSSIARQITLWTANDAEERDPASVSIYGTNTILGAGSHLLSDFTPIGVDLALALPPTRNAGGANPLLPENSQTLGLSNSTAYLSYMIVFPTVKNEGAANSMQIGEIQLDTTAIPEPGSTSLLLLGLATLLYRRKR